MQTESLLLFFVKHERLGTLSEHCLVPETNIRSLFRTTLPSITKLSGSEAFDANEMSRCGWPLLLLGVDVPTHNV